jgi:hypothetical protein
MFYYLTLGLTALSYSNTLMDKLQNFARQKVLKAFIINTLEEIGLKNTAKSHTHY